MAAPASVPTIDVAGAAPGRRRYGFFWRPCRPTALCSAKQLARGPRTHHPPRTRLPSPCWSFRVALAMPLLVLPCWRSGHRGAESGMLLEVFSGNPANCGPATRLAPSVAYSTETGVGCPSGAAGRSFDNKSSHCAWWSVARAIYAHLPVGVSSAPLRGLLPGWCWAGDQHPHGKPHLGAFRDVLSGRVSSAIS